VTLVAGVDIGNATTEIVIVDLPSARPVAWDRARTIGVKGSPEAARAAGRLLTRIQARHDLRVELAILTHQSPVLTRRIDLPVRPPETGRLRQVAQPSATPGGCGFAAGRPIDIDTPIDAHDGMPAGPLIAVSRDPLGYLRTVAVLQRWDEIGLDVRGILLAGDEATLVSRRLPRGLPIVDGADADLALQASLIAIEVAPPGHACRELSDPLRLAATLGPEGCLDPEVRSLAEASWDVATHAHAAEMAACVTGHRCAAIALLPVHSGEPAPLDDPTALTALALFADGSSVPLAQATSILDAGDPSVVGTREPGGGVMAAADLWLVDPTVLARIPGLRQDDARMSRLAVSALSPHPIATGGTPDLGDTWGGLIRVIGTEAAAARVGACSTPGVAADALVVDLGGGTIDVVAGNATWTGAGCGDLMTVAASIVTDTSRATAEWVKRGPAWRVETPHLAVDESGDRRFLDVPAPHGSVGWLVTSGPSGDLPFTRTLTGSQWRTIRLALKEEVFGRNLRRGLARMQASRARDIVLVGGPAGDEEILEAVHAAIPEARIGRADVGGMLGHRWAVAYGLVLLHHASAGPNAVGAHA